MKVGGWERLAMRGDTLHQEQAARVRVVITCCQCVQCMASMMVIVYIVK